MISHQMCSSTCRELLEQTLLKLDPFSVKNCALLSREFNTFISASIAFQYLFACHVAGVVNNPCHKAPYAERCEALLKRERHGTGSSQVSICLAMPNNTKISTIAPFHPPLAMCLDGPPSAPMDQAYFPCLLQSPLCQATMLEAPNAAPASHKQPLSIRNSETAPHKLSAPLGIVISLLP